MKVIEIAYTGTPVTDIKRARAFYEGVLGLKPTMEADGGLWVGFDIGTGTFGIGCFGELWKPSPDGTCVAFEVEDLDVEISRLQSQDVPFARGGCRNADLPICHHLRPGREQDSDSQEKGLMRDVRETAFRSCSFPIRATSS